MDIPVSVRILFKSVPLRFIVIVIVAFWEYTEPDFVKGRFGEGVHGLADQLFRLVDQGVHRGSEGGIGGAVLIGKVFSTRLNHAVAAAVRGLYQKGPFPFDTSGDAVPEGACFWGEKTDFISAVSGIKAFERLLKALSGDDSGHIHVCTAALGFSALQGKFCGFKLFHDLNPPM